METPEFHLSDNENHGLETELLPNTLFLAELLNCNRLINNQLG